MSDLKSVFELKNLKRAYRWILSNPDARYKSYFRDSYDAFAIASDTHIRWIRQEGIKDRYEVSHASKILVPKPSGTLRPLTLLTVEDQIVYQACVNMIAEALKKQTLKRYETRIFAHLYAGKSSPFFYKRWQNGYRKFGRQIIDAHGKGLGCSPVRLKLWCAAFKLLPTPTRTLRSCPLSPTPLPALSLPRRSR